MDAPEGIFHGLSATYTHSHAWHSIRVVGRDRAYAALQGGCVGHSIVSRAPAPGRQVQGMASMGVQASAG